MSTADKYVKNIADEVKSDTLTVFQDTWILIPNWKWLGLAIAIVGGVILMKLLDITIDRIRQMLLKRTEAGTLKAFFLQMEVHKPFSLMLTALFWMAALQALALPENADKLLHIVAKLALSYAVLRLLYLGSDALGQVIHRVAARTENTLDDQLAPLLTRTLKIVVIILGFLVILQNFGVNVVSLLAGLGLGGLALALAAQDTAANLFGSVTIILDRPFQIGDHIKVGDTEGTIEEIGLRSTRVRTFSKTLVTIPNSMMAKEKIENFGLRPNRRCKHVIGFSYDTKPEQILAFMDHVRYILTQRPEIVPGEITLAFNQLADSSLNVLVQFFFTASTGDEELQVQQEVLFHVIEIAKQLKMDFAFPTQTLHIAGLADAPMKMN